jgi:lantibiotic modifying enzyme
VTLPTSKQQPRASRRRGSRLDELIDGFSPTIRELLSELERNHAHTLQLSPPALSDVRHILENELVRLWLPSLSVADGLSHLPQMAISHASESALGFDAKRLHSDHSAWLTKLSVLRLHWIVENLHRAFEQVVVMRRGLMDLIGPVESVERLRIPPGETHNGGRSPLILTFLGGTRVVYKPVPLEAEAVFLQVMDWLAMKHPGFESFIRPRVIPVEEESGFVEFIQHTPVANVQAAHRFFRRAGLLLALAYALNATDMHMENMIAVGEYPVPIDLETLFYRYPSQILRHDVTLTGLIQGGSAPTSGLQGGGPVLILGTHGDKDAAGRLTTRYLARARHVSNRVAIGYQRAHPARYANDILAGFSEGYRAIRESSSSLLRIIEKEAQRQAIRVRHLLRFTTYYLLHILWLIQPQPLAVAENRLEKHLRQDESAAEPYSDLIFGGEAFDLSHGDVPYFWTFVSSTDLHHKTGVVPGYFSASALDALACRLSTLCERNLTEQVHVIRESLRGGHIP